MDTKKLINIKDLAHTGVEYKQELLKLYEEATEYLKKQNWCVKVLDCWYDRGLADKLAVFYFKIDPTKGADEYVWMVVGDLPPAYIDIESAVNGACAIQAYTDIMEDWVRTVKEGGDMDEVYPVNVPVNEKHADMLASRIKFIRENVLVDFTEELKEY